MFACFNVSGYVYRGVKFFGEHEEVLEKGIRRGSFKDHKETRDEEV